MMFCREQVAGRRASEDELSTAPNLTARSNPNARSIMFKIQLSHIGFSGWHNFDIMALRKSSRGIICDANPENALFLLATLGILRTSANRAYFISRMVEYVSSHEKRSYAQHEKDNDQSVTFCANFRLPAESNSAADEIKNHLLEQSGWLVNEER